MRAWIILAALAASTFLYVTTETLPIGLLPQIADDLGTAVRGRPARHRLRTDGRGRDASR